MRSCNALTFALRLRYSGNTPQIPTHGAAHRVRPPSRWQLVQFSALPRICRSVCWRMRKNAPAECDGFADRSVRIWCVVPSRIAIVVGGRVAVHRCNTSAMTSAIVDVRTHLFSLNHCRISLQSSRLQPFDCAPLTASTPEGTTCTPGRTAASQSCLTVSCGTPSCCARRAL